MQCQQSNKTISCSCCYDVISKQTEAGGKDKGVAISSVGIVTSSHRLCHNITVPLHVVATQSAACSLHTDIVNIARLACQVWIAQPHDRKCDYRGDLKCTAILMWAALLSCTAPACQQRCSANLVNFR